MNRCPLTYEPLPAGASGRYSQRGLRRLAPRLTHLDDLPYSAEQQRREALARAHKLSIQGIQPKLSARLAVRQGRFELVDRGGSFILKPQVVDLRHLPENEDLTMRLAAAVGIELPQHGLLYSSDESLTYFVKRFDRTGRHAKVAVEDFAQLSLRTRETKYSASMEQVAEVLERFTTFPTIARRELFLRTVFCFLVGNEDMHLKNLSLITSRDRISLSPAYDLVSTTLVLPGVREELALSIRGRKNRLTRSDLIDSFGRERLALTNQAIDGALARFQAAADEWEALVAASFLPADLQRAYRELLRERAARLFG